MMFLHGVLRYLEHKIWRSRPATGFLDFCHKLWSNRHHRPLYNEMFGLWTSSRQSSIISYLPQNWVGSRRNVCRHDLQESRWLWTTKTRLLTPPSMCTIEWLPVKSKRAKNVDYQKANGRRESTAWSKTSRPPAIRHSVLSWVSISKKHFGCPVTYKCEEVALVNFKNM